MEFFELKETQGFFSRDNGAIFGNIVMKIVKISFFIVLVRTKAQLDRIFPKKQHFPKNKLSDYDYEKSIPI